MPQGDCVDDPAIQSHEILWRYVHPTQVTTDPETGQKKPMSGVFRDSKGRMSVDIASMTTLTAAKLRNPNKSIAGFTVGYVRGISKCVTQKLDPDPTNPAHAVVCPKLTGSEATKLSDQPNIWIDPPL